MKRAGMEEDKIERIERMKKEALHELLHNREKSIKQRCKDIIKKAAGRYVPPKDGIFWDTGLLANGLMETAGDGEILEAVRQYFDRWIKKGMPVYYVDDTLCGVALLQVYRATGEEKYSLPAFPKKRACVCGRDRHDVSFFGRVRCGNGERECGPACRDAD